MQAAFPAGRAAVRARAQVFRIALIRCRIADALVRNIPPEIVEAGSPPEEYLDLRESDKALERWDSTAEVRRVPRLVVHHRTAARVTDVLETVHKSPCSHPTVGTRVEE